MRIKEDNVAICFVSNMGYLQHFYSALASFIKFNKGEHEFFLFNEDIPEKEIYKLKNWLLSISPKSEMTDVKLDTSRLPNFTGYWEKLGKQVFHRLLIPNELSERFKYALYLDADIIINDQLDFDSHTLSNHTIAAIKDSISDVLAPKRNLPAYFNAGIMLINVSRWRQKDSLSKLLVHKPAFTLFAEQELLNEVFEGDWQEIDSRFNYPANKLLLTMNGYKMKNGGRPAIIHYLGGIKPWKLWVRGSFLYWNFIWQTPNKWRILHAPLTVFNSLLHLCKKPFR